MTIHLQITTPRHDGALTWTGPACRTGDGHHKSTVSRDNVTCPACLARLGCPEEFFNAYVEAALWSSVGDCDGTVAIDTDISDISDETLAAMGADCDLFWAQCSGNVTCDDGPTGRNGSSQIAIAGHDFWLTRCGHGAGFWDGDWPEPHAAFLTNASDAFGNVDLYLGEDKQVHHD